jgi:hypothetical protein
LIISCWTFTVSLIPGTVHGLKIISQTWQTAFPIKAYLRLKAVQVANSTGIVFISERGILSGPPPEVEHIVQYAAQFGVVLTAQESRVLLIANAGLLEGKRYRQPAHLQGNGGKLRSHLHTRAGPEG